MDGLVALSGEAAHGNAHARPVNARVRQCAGDEVVHDLGDLLFTTEAVVEGFEVVGLGNLCALGGDLGRGLFTASFAVAAKLFALGHALLGALVGFVTAGGEEVVTLFLGGGPAAGDCEQNSESSASQSYSPDDRHRHDGSP